MHTHLIEQKNRNIRKTWFLMGLVTCSVLVLGYFLSVQFKNPFIFNIFIVFSIVQNLVSFWFSDKIALSSSGAKKITEADYPELFRIANDLARTVQIQTPRLYVIHDSAPNAFATGRNEKNAAVAVTTGLLDILNENELRGVIAHEFGHIQNRDILINTVAGVLIGFIIMILHSFMGFRGENNGERNVGLSLVFIIIISLLAPLVGQLIQLAISRKREFLADATGALATHEPHHLARALEKISMHSQPLKRVTQETAHLFFANPYGTMKTLFMSHPPVEERISALLGKEKNDGFR